jgi:DNA ligase-1
MADYFRQVEPADAAWSLFFLTGRRFKRFVSSAKLREWAIAALEIPDWLYEDAHIAVGDTAETISLLMAPKDGQALANPLSQMTLSDFVTNQLLPLQGKLPEEQASQVVSWWQSLERRDCFLVNKLLLGGFRVGVSQSLVVRSLAEVSGLEPAVISHRLMGNWEPDAEFFMALIAESGSEMNHSQPYPFFLASPLEAAAETLGPITDWQLEWKWDGIRAQLIKRNGELFLWSRGEDLLNGRFPEIEQAADALPDGLVLDGEVLAYQMNRPLPFARLQQRIGRKTLSARVLQDAPAVFMVYDLLEWNGSDYRSQPLVERRARLEGLVANLSPQTASALMPSPLVVASDWNEAAQLREQARELGVEGLMIKRLSSVYQTGRKRGDWWKWKIDPFTIDAVMLYAQAGHGRRANLYTDYIFALWQEDKLVPVAKAYSGLSDAEIRELDRWIRDNTLERFGPVRSVQAIQVFELAFEGISKSSRHKSGVAVRFPRILRWRKDKLPEQANTLGDLVALTALSE